MKRLEEEMSRLTQRLEEERTAMQEALAELQKRSSSLPDMSELLSIRYNPFLDDAEPRIFDGHRLRDEDDEDDEGPARRRTPSRRTASSGNGPYTKNDDYSDDFPAHPAPTPTSRRSNPIPAPPPHDPFEDEELEEGPEEPAPLAKRTPAAPAHTPTPEPDEDEARGPVPLISPTVPNPGIWGGPRKAFLAMTWFENLINVAHQHCLHPFIDHYRRVGWLDDDLYLWLQNLAEGITPRKESLTFMDLGIEPRTLVKTHQASLAFIQRVFRDNLQDEEVDRLRDYVRSIFGGE